MHIDCSRLKSPGRFAPSRLIDVGVHGDDNWKLCLYPEDVVDPPEYMTLSYRWGADPTIVLLSSNMDRFRQGEPIQNLPRMFRDAIAVVRKFSIKYLWIDSLCILQDSKDDWQVQSNKMHEIYTYSACTISATASLCPDEGLFRSRKPSQVLPGYIKIGLPGDPGKKYDIWDEFYMERQIRGPLTDRGWVFQERHLSPRVLHFTSTQVFWECFTADLCEAFPKFAPSSTMLPLRGRFKTCQFMLRQAAQSISAQERDQQMDESLYNQWCQLLGQYTGCALTKPDDRLIAMAGIAQLYQQHTQDQYIAGLWKSRLLEGLDWVVVDPVARPANSSRAPSWSWAAVDSAVIPQTVKFGHSYLITARHIPPTLISGSFGAGQRPGDSVELVGIVTLAVVSYSHSREARSENLRLTMVDLASTLYAYPDAAGESFEKGRVLHLLPIKTRLATHEGADDKKNPLGELTILLEGFILQPVSGARVTYRRIGRFVFADPDHVGFFGLRGGAMKQDKPPLRAEIADDARISVIELV
ncbi:heterokaryon incompatibility protein [Colletotrichum tofieldiae]|nr:heterokaryon incompatibility protein [Colletotrichum tofieldiae]GKT82109.1 heterokaryon incompatibility protein [Colletotrichum tofieldiae]